MKIFTDEDRALAATLKKEAAAKKKSEGASYEPTAAPEPGAEGLLYYLFGAKDWRGDEIEPGKWAVQCPREDEHSRGEAYDGSTVIWAAAPGKEVGAFCCLHSGSGHNAWNVGDVIAMFTDDEQKAARDAAGITARNEALLAAFKRIADARDAPRASTANDGAPSTSPTGAAVDANETTATAATTDAGAASADGAAAAPRTLNMLELVRQIEEANLAKRDAKIAAFVARVQAAPAETRNGTAITDDDIAMAVSLPAAALADLEATLKTAGVKLKTFRARVTATRKTARLAAKEARDAVAADLEDAGEEGDGDEARATADHSDIGNAEKLVAVRGDDLRFVTDWKKWLTWDGMRWVEGDGAAYAAAVDTARWMLADARARLAEARKLSGPERAAAMARAADDIAWAKRSQNHKSLVAMLAVASSYPFIALRHQDLDGEPMLLNCTNGEIDLVTGTLHPHRRESLCTKLVPIAYDSDAKAPRWEQFVSETMAGDPAKIGYLQRSVGYGITGDVREDALFFFYGTGANGKSTFIRIITEMLGTDYAGPAPRQLLLLRRGEHHPTELAGLFRQRWVTCSEISDGAALDEALVKDLTGRDLIEVRRMREDFWTFAPTHKLIMAGNYKPRITGTDDGIWRRVRLVPWLVTFAKDQQDKGLTKKLRAELAGILAWAVRGCLEWQQSGLGEPESVLAATAEYRSDSDSLGRFIRERLTFAPGESVARKVVRATYETWAEDEGCQPVGARRLADRLRAGGARETSKRPAPGQPAVDAWGDLRLATDDERAARRGVDETVPATSETTTGNATTTVPSAAADMAPRGVNVAATGLAIVVGSASPEASTAGPSIKTPVTENIVTPAFDGMPHAPANDLDDREEIDL